jgi:uncharacterized membrane protein
MSEVTQGSRLTDGSECCKLRELFRSFQIARQPANWTLAIVGVVLTYATGRILDGIWSDDSTPVVMADGTTELSCFVANGGDRAATRDWLAVVAGDDVGRRGAFAMLLDHGRHCINRVCLGVVRLEVGEVWGGLVASAGGMLWLFALHPLYAVLFFILSLMIWAMFGGALCRSAVLHAARDEHPPMREALRFACERWVSFLFSPLMAMMAVLFCGLALIVGGLVGLIPAVGEVLVALFFVLAICVGVAAAFLMIGGVAGLPLTFPTIAAEGSDAFDAVSRSFAYVYQRPWRTAWYYLLSIGYAAICLLFVKFFARLALWTGHFFVGVLMNRGEAALAEGADAGGAGKLDAIWSGPGLFDNSTFWGAFDGPPLAHFTWFAQFLMTCWIYGVWAVVAALAVSLFYSSSTLIYLLLRRDVDATDIEDVYLDDLSDEEFTSTGPGATGKSGGESTKTDSSGGGTSLPVVN